MKLALNVRVLEHLIDLLCVQSAASLFLSVYVALLAGQSTDQVVEEVSLRVTRASGATFERHYFNQSELWNDDQLFRSWI